MAAVAAACGGEPSSTKSGEAGGAGGSSSAAGGSADTGVFIAFAADFKDYTTWPKFDLGVLIPTVNEIEGPRTLFINRAPEHGATEFPVGTIIVKAIETGTPAEWQIFAMVKRGGGFNYLGAQNWEWFELTQTDDMQVVVQWRGIAPPSGMGYGGGTKGGVCNTCHQDAAANDFVQGDAMALSRF